jgi:hypothetical protein
MTTDHRPLNTYRVRVGHWQTQVRARDEAEALIVARIQLGRELPRLYDVIRSLTPAQIRIERAA